MPVFYTTANCLSGSGDPAIVIALAVINVLALISLIWAITRR